MLAANKISEVNFSQPALLSFIDLLRPALRAKTIFLHNSILMLERSDVNGDLARARYAKAEKANFLVNPMSNRAFT